MSFYYNLVTYIKFKDLTQKENVLKYLLEDTRPDFEEDVPANEKELFECFEHADSCEHIKLTELEHIFTYDDEDIKYRLPKLFSYFDVQHAGMFIDAEDTEREYYYFDLQKGKFSLVYTEGDDETLDGELEKFENIYEKIELIISRSKAVGLGTP
jgi:hypothetical protein